MQHRRVDPNPPPAAAREEKEAESSPLREDRAENGEHAGGLRAKAQAAGPFEHTVRLYGYGFVCALPAALCACVYALFEWTDWDSE